jgi:hypothetical protein
MRLLVLPVKFKSIPHDDVTLVSFGGVEYW